MASSYNLRKTTNNQPNSTTTLATIDGLTSNVDANTDYRFEFMIPFSSVATTTGLALAVTCPASPIFITYTVIIPFAADGADAFWEGVGTTSGDKVISTGVPAANTVYFARVIGLLRNGVNAGTLAMQFSSEVAASEVTVRTGAWGTVDGCG